MARYIDADLLLERIYPYNGVDKSKYAINAKAVFEAIRKSPTADVVPKSEVEMLQGALKAEERHNELTMEMAQKALKNAKAEVAREIFEEIEQLRLEFLTEKITGADLIVKLFLLKKKYTEDQT